MMNNLSARLFVDEAGKKLPDVEIQPAYDNV
jgi:hypothetical protein